MNDWFALWTPLGVLLTALAGALAGAFIASPIIQRFPMFGATRHGHAALQAVLVAWMGFFFWSPQVIVSLLSNDPMWERVVSRALIWLLVFAPASYVGAWLMGWWLRKRLPKLPR